MNTHSNKNGAMVRRSVERFWTKVSIPEDKRKCFEWLGYKDKDGYGRHRPGKGKNYVGAHRFAWELSNGEIPRGMCVLHRCDNRGCVNVLHLFLGTNFDNVTDMVTKGRNLSGDKHPCRLRPERMARGEQHGQSKMTAEKVREMREAYENGARNVTELARRYGIHNSTAWDIVHMKSWKHVQPLTPGEE